MPLLLVAGCASSSLSISATLIGRSLETRTAPSGLIPGFVTSSPAHLQASRAAGRNLDAVRASQIVDSFVPGIARSSWTLAGSVPALLIT